MKRFALLLVMIPLFLIGGRRPAAAQAQKGTLRVALTRVTSSDFRHLGTRDPEKILEAGQPFGQYLERETGAKIELSTIPINRTLIVDMVAKGEVDIVNFGGLEYVQALVRAGVRPLVQREGDQKWQTAFITQPDSGINTLNDLNGRRFAFSEATSVSSRVMPEYWMREAGVDPKVYETALYTGNHEATVLAVASKKVDAGALDRKVVEEMMRDGRITPQQVRVFLTPRKYSDGVWAARRDLNSKLAQSFANAMLKLEMKNAEDKRILEFLSATKYVRAKESGYVELRKAAEADGLLR